MLINVVKIVIIAPQEISMMEINVGQFLNTASPLRSKVEYAAIPKTPALINALLIFLSFKEGIITK